MPTAGGKHAARARSTSRSVPCLCQSYLLRHLEICHNSGKSPHCLGYTTAKFTNVPGVTDAVYNEYPVNGWGCNANCRS